MLCQYIRTLFAISVPQTYITTAFFSTFVLLQLGTSLDFQVSCATSKTNLLKLVASVSSSMSRPCIIRITGGRLRISCCPVECRKSEEGTQSVKYTTFSCISQLWCTNKCCVFWQISFFLYGLKTTEMSYLKIEVFRLLGHHTSKLKCLVFWDVTPQNWSV
jgi:hypothetical protein